MIAGTFITATFKPGRSPCASATHMTPINGNGGAASIRARPGEIRSGTSATFDEARAEFETAWQVFLSNRTEADFRTWRNPERPDCWNNLLHSKFGNADT
jgi:hypothetical protein